MTKDLTFADPELKRLRMRAWRRGIREMDLILGPFADDRLGNMAPATLQDFEVLLEANDHDLYRWVTTPDAAPARLAPLMAEISRHAHGRLMPGAPDISPGLTEM
jgi:antitoxin CptB